MEHLTPIKNSACFKGYAYDAGKKALTLQFKSGGTYTYQGVKSVTVTRMMKSRTPGKFFHSNIKGQYRWAKVS